MAEGMVVTIEFFGVQRSITKADSIRMPVTERTSASDALEYVRNRYPALNLDGGILIAVNQEVAPPDRSLRANDVVCFVPHIGGG